jgi:hypothetical protein
VSFLALALGPEPRPVGRQGPCAGSPYLVPHLVLLFKARWARDQDQADLAGVLPLLADGQGAWVAATIERLHPGHQWLDQL